MIQPERFLPWLILYIRDALTPYLSAIRGAFSPEAKATFTCATSSSVSLWVGWFSPRRFTNPVRHWCFVLSQSVTHSRFPGRLFSLFPSMWLTVRPGWKPSQNAEAISRWRRYLGRLLPTFTLMCRYPLLPTQGDSPLAGRVCTVRVPSLVPSVRLDRDLALPRLETSMNSGHRGDVFQTSTSIVPPVCPYRLQVSK